MSDFITIFQKELLDESIDHKSRFKNHGNWSSLISLVIITEIEKEFEILVEVEQLREAQTIEDLYNLCIVKA